MSTARDIIKRMMQKIGVLVKSEAPSDDEARDALATLNALISSWGNDSSMITARAWESFPLVGGTGSYTMSTGLTFNTTRPIAIIAAYVRSGTTDYDLGIIDDEQYNSIINKSVTSIPLFLNFDNAFPTDTIRLYPIPAAAYTLFILSEKPLTGLVTLDTELSMQPGVERALIYNGALELAPEYGQQPDPSVVKIAAESLGLVRLANIKARGVNWTPSNLGVENINTGWYS